MSRLSLIVFACALGVFIGSCKTRGKDIDGIGRWSLSKTELGDLPATIGCRDLPEQKLVECHSPHLQGTVAAHGRKQRLQLQVYFPNREIKSHPVEILGYVRACQPRIFARWARDTFGVETASSPPDAVTPVEAYWEQARTFVHISFARKEMECRLHFVPKSRLQRVSELKERLAKVPVP